MNNEAINSLKTLGVKSLRNFGFVNVTEENILSDEVYKFFFGRFLVSKKGSNKKLDVDIDKLLNSISDKL